MKFTFTFVPLNLNKMIYFFSAFVVICLILVFVAFHYATVDPKDLEKDFKAKKRTP